MKIRNINGKEVEFKNDEIESVTFPYAFEVMDASDLTGNGVKPQTNLICIAQKDGQVATYAARNWAIVEV